MSTTTTTLPFDEICGNCLDDDGNGLADWEDPACCANGDLDVLAIRRVRIRGDADSSRLRVRAVLDGDGAALLEAGVRDLFVQIAQDAALPLTCARIDGARFRLKKRGLSFRDKRNTVVEAAGIDRVQIRVMRSGRTKIRLDARRALFGLPDPGDFRVVLAVDRLLATGEPVVCLRGVSELVSARRGLKLP